MISMPSLSVLTLFASESAAGHAVSHVPGWMTAFFTILLVAMVAALAFEEKLHAKKSIIVGTFAGLCLILEAMFASWFQIPLLPFGEITLPNGHHISMPVYIPGIDWSVITVILGASLFVEVT
ncbi:MAG: hypothetical protein KDA78_15535, partial [Planctomycetaceae bacterium]|nr:hypothetical protein [Planctomycetaceae bacterium]